MSPRSIKLTLALLLATGAIGLALHGQPTLEDRVRQMEAELEDDLREGRVQIDPGELLALMHDDRMRLRVVDLRDEAGFNLFHLLDSHRLTREQIAGSWGEGLHPETVIVLVDRDGRRAEWAYQRLRARRFANVYLLDGGIGHWVEAFDQCLRDGHVEEIRPAAYPREMERVLFPAALGAKHPLSRPARAALEHRSYEAKVKVDRPAATLSGGCG